MDKDGTNSNAGVERLAMGGERPKENGFLGMIRSAWKGVIGEIDRIMRVEPSENDKWKPRVIFALASAAAIATIVFALWSDVKSAKPLQEKKPQEKTAPAPRKAEGTEVHANDAFYKMAFSRPLPKSTFVAAPQPAPQNGQRVASRLS